MASSAGYGSLRETKTVSLRTALQSMLENGQSLGSVARALLPGRPLPARAATLTRA
jgi:hypothetical protein